MTRVFGIHVSLLIYIYIYGSLATNNFQDLYDLNLTFKHGGLILQFMPKKTALLSMKYWLFNWDAYFMG